MKYKKITLLFPGQGSQYVGMGKEFYEHFEVAREIFSQANEVLGYDMAEKCFKKPTIGRKMMHWTDLDKTVYTQPAVLITSYACYRVFQEKCMERHINFDFSLLAGHSLGEYTALLVSGAMDFPTCLDLVNKRATYITEFGETYPHAGLMAIVDRNNHLDYDRIDQLCRDFAVYITLINTRNQIVVGGFKKNLSELSKKLRKDGTVASNLRVEGPFHTPFMKPAADKFKQELDRTWFYIASRPVISNVSTEAIADPDQIRRELHQQIFTHVDWRNSMEKAIGNKTDLFIEIGPKTILSKMVKNIDGNVPRLNVENLESLEKTLAELS